MVYSYIPDSHGNESICINVYINPLKNAPKPRHKVQFICTRFLAGGLRKIFRTVRICLFAYKIKKTILRFFF